MRRGPIVLATDGTSQNGATVVAAQLLADRIGMPLGVVTVLEPVPLFGGELNVGLTYPWSSTNPLATPARRL